MCHNLRHKISYCGWTKLGKDERKKHAHTHRHTHTHRSLRSVDFEMTVGKRGLLSSHDAFKHHLDTGHLSAFSDSNNMMEP
jgi:hypothetical protein